MKNYTKAILDADDHCDTCAAKIAKTIEDLEDMFSYYDYVPGYLEEYINKGYKIAKKSVGYHGGFSEIIRAFSDGNPNFIILSTDD